MQPIQTPQQYLQQLTIAVNVTLSGPLQKYGQEVVKGVQAAVDEQNRFNAPVSHVVGIASARRPQRSGLAASNANVAAADFTVIGMIGNLTAPMTLAALSRYANVGFAVIVPTVTADAVTKRGYHNVYRLPAKDSPSGRLFASAALEGKRGVPAIADRVRRRLWIRSRAAGSSLQATNRPAPRRCLALSARQDRSGAGGAYGARPLAGLRLSRRKDGRAGADRAKRYALAGYTGDFGAADGFYNSETISTYAKTLDGAYVASPMPPIDRVPSAVQLVTDFEREVSQITTQSAYGYAAAQLIDRGLAARKRDVAQRRCCASLQAGGTFTTLVGQFAFNISGDPLIPNIYLYTVGTDGFKFARPAFARGSYISNAAVKRMR